MVSETRGTPDQGWWVPITRTLTDRPEAPDGEGDDAGMPGADTLNVQQTVTEPRSFGRLLLHTQRMSWNVFPPKRGSQLRRRVGQSGTHTINLDTVSHIRP